MDDARQYALAHPLPPGGDATRYRSRAQTSDGLILTSCLTTEVCGCLGPVWHVSVSLQRPGIAMLGDPGSVYLVHKVAHNMLDGVGRPEQEMWWWHAEVKVGHLRVHLTNAERLLMGPGIEELPDDHDEPGEWLDRNAPIAVGR